MPRSTPPTRSQVSEPDAVPLGKITNTFRPLLREAGKDGTELEKDLARLLPLKTKAEYEPDAVPLAEARRAVERARRCIAVARRVASPQ